MILNIVEKILNHYLHLDPVTEQRLIALAGKVIAIRLQPLNWSIYFILTQDGIHLADRYQGSVDVTMSGASFDFLRLSWNSSNTSFLNSNVVVEGDLEVAQQFKELFAHLDVDWEEQLSRVTGDVVAHQIGRFMRAFSAWARQSAVVMRQNITEYVQEEAR